MMYLDDKEAQIVINRARPMTDFANNAADTIIEEMPKQGTLYLKLPTEEGKLFPKIKAILNMFPGDNNVVLYFADTKVRRGTRCAFHKEMLKELQSVLGQENVVVK